MGSSICLSVPEITMPSKVAAGVKSRKSLQIDSIPPGRRLGCRQPNGLFGIIHRDHTCRPRIPQFASTTSSPASNIQQMQPGPIECLRDGGIRIGCFPIAEDVCRTGTIGFFIKPKQAPIVPFTGFGLFVFRTYRHSISYSNVDTFNKKTIIAVFLDVD